MGFSIFDIVGIAIFLLIALFFYAKGWFYSFYSFFKFLLVAIISLLLAVFIASKNQFNLPLTNLQLSLLMELIFFAILWKLISFKKIFFKITDGIIGINRFVFQHRIDKILNVFPSLIASLFVCFFFFSLAGSLSANSKFLADSIGNSKVVRPAFNEIYFAKLSSNGLGLFNNVAYRLVEPVKATAGTGVSNVTQAALNAFTIKLNVEREKDGLSPIGAMVVQPTFNGQYTEAPGTISSGDQTVNPPDQSNFLPQNNTQILPTAAPIPTPTPTLTVLQQPVNVVKQIIAPEPTATPIPQPPVQITYILLPTATPVPIATPPPPPPPVDLNQAAQDIFNLTNQERSQNGLAPFRWSDSLAAVARAHSQDMVDRNYFDHTSPDGLTFDARIRAGGINFQVAAENIGKNVSAATLVDGWWNSPPHKANVLNPQFGTIGIGVAEVDLGYSRILVGTEDFTN